jgi:hypothetical protein
VAGLIGAVLPAAVLTLATSQADTRAFATYSISGTVIYSSGPIPPKLIVMVHRPTRQGGSGQSCDLKPDGRFTATGLQAGTYVLEAVPRADGPRDHPIGYERGFAVVTVRDADVTGVMIKTAPGVTVRGRLHFDESRPGSSRPQFVLVHLALAVAEWAGPSQSTAVGEDGTFELHDVRGPRVFRFGWTLGADRSYWGPATILLDGRDITNIPVDFSREPAGELVVVFRQRTSAIVGRVEDVAGLPASVCVAMLPEDPELQHGWSTAVDTREADAHGRFYFTNMPPGAYLVAALNAATCPPRDRIIRRARELARGATRATVTEDATVHVVVAAAPTTGQP